MMINIKTIVSTVIIGFTLVSCLYEKGGVVTPVDNSGTNTGTTSGATLDTTGGNSATLDSTFNAICNLSSGGTVSTTNENGQVCFDSQILPLFVSKCAESGCHDSKTKKDGYDLSSYASIVKKGISSGKPNNSKLYTVLSASGGDRMPPSPRAQLTSAEKKLIADWITQGAKEVICNTSTGGTGSIPAGTVISFANHVKPIMDISCVGCHSANSPSGGINLIGYANVKAQGANGKLVGSITYSSGYVGMPQGYKLSDCQVAAISAWVDQGMANN